MSLSDYKEYFRTHSQGALGAGSTFLATCLVQPLEIIKMVMIVKANQNNFKLTKVQGAIEYIYKTEGVFGFYRGLRPAIARNMSAGFLYFQALAYISQSFKERTATTDFFSSFSARGYISNTNRDGLFWSLTQSS